MSRSIKAIFPEVEPKERRLQVDVPESLYDKADRIRRKRRLRWGQVVEGLLDKFVEDLTKTPHRKQLIRPSYDRYNQINLL